MNLLFTRGASNAVVCIGITVWISTVTGCSGGSGTSPTGDRRPPAAVPVSVARAESRDVPVQINAVGKVEAHSTVSIRAQIEGALQKVHFQEGSEVRGGDLLFTIDPRPFEADLRFAEANLARHIAEADNANAEAKRLANLFDQGFVSRDEHEAGQTRAAASRSQVDADRAATERARLELDYCFLRSPIDGRIGQVLVHEGNTVKARETVLAVINQTRPAYVTFAVPERQLGAIREYASRRTLELVASVNDGRASASGRLDFVNNTVDPDTGTILLKGEFPNQDEVLWPGQFVDVALTLDTRHDAVVVPATAVQTGQQGNFAFVVTSEKTVELRPLKVGQRNGDEVVIDDGVRAGETVVTDGQLRLQPGAPVEIKEQKPA